MNPLAVMMVRDRLIMRRLCSSEVSVAPPLRWRQRVKMLGTYEAGMLMMCTREVKVSRLGGAAVQESSRGDLVVLPDSVGSSGNRQAFSMYERPGRSVGTWYGQLTWRSVLDMAWYRKLRRVL